MAMRTIDILEEQPKLSELLNLVSSGDEVLIVDGDRQLAKLVPIASPARERVAGLTPGAIWISDDFDEPLPDEFWLGSE